MSNENFAASNYGDPVENSRHRIQTFLTTNRPAKLFPESPSSISSLRNGELFPFVIALIPAFNEQDNIEKTIRSLREQTRHPDEIIVIADNCTDSTVALALGVGASVMETQNNHDGKAGALNIVLAELLPLLDFDDSILVMDADTVLNPRFIEATVNMLFTPSRRPIAGVGGIFLADDDNWNLVRQLQSNEYVRYQRRLSRRGGRALVLTGTGTVFKAGVLRQVQNARVSGRLPDLGRTGAVYDTSALTEDNELTISVKELGYRVVSPKDCTVKTAMMPDLLSLYKQRRRWQRGALENILAHRINIHTAPYLLRQILTYLGVYFVPFYFFTLGVALYRQSGINFLHPFWITVAIVYLVEQTFSVRRGGFRAIVVSLLVLPELFLNIFLNLIYIITLIGTLFASDEAWGRMRHIAPSGSPVQFLSEESLHGTHNIRKSLKARFFEFSLAVIAILCTILFFAIPLVDLQVAWNVIAVYVIAGFTATIGRLIPLRTF